MLRNGFTTVSRCKNKQWTSETYLPWHICEDLFIYIPRVVLSSSGSRHVVASLHPRFAHWHPRFRTSFCLNTQNHGQVNPTSASLAHVPIMFYLQTWIFQNTAPGKIQTILRQSRANCHPTRLCGYVESDKCCSPPWQPLETCNGEMCSWCANSTAFLVGGKGNKVCVASCFLGNGLSLAVCFWVFVCSLRFTVKTRQFFLDLVTVFWGSLVCLPSSLETFSAKKAAETSGYLCAEVDQLHHLFEATMTQDFTGYKLRLRCTVSIYNIWQICIKLIVY